MLIESIQKEFVFVLEFFDLRMGQVSYIFNQIFQRTIHFYLDWLKSSTSAHCFDIYSVLLMILINEENKAYMVRQKIPVLDFYFDKVNMILWPRLTMIFEQILENVKKANKKQFKLN